MARDPLALVNEWTRLRLDDVVDDEALLKFVCAPRELEDYRTAFLQHGDLTDQATVGEVYRCRLRCVDEAGRRGLLSSGSLTSENARWGPRRAESICAAIGADPQDLISFWAVFGRDAERFWRGTLTASGETEWFEPKELVPYWVEDVHDPDRRRYREFYLGDGRPPRFPQLIEHLLEIDGAAISLAPGGGDDLGSTSFILIDIDRHSGDLEETYGYLDERLILPEGRVFARATDDTTADRLRLVLNAFGARPRALVTSPRGLYGVWAAPGTAGPAWFKKWAEWRIVEAGGQRELETQRIEVRLDCRVPLGIGSRLVDRWFRPIFPLSWQTKGQELRAFCKAMRKGPTIREELLVDLYKERHVSIDASSRSRRTTPTASSLPAPKKLLRDGLPGEGTLNAALLSLNWYFQVGADGPHLAPPQAEDALWAFARENAPMSKDMQMRPRWVRDKCRRLAHTLERWMRRHGMTLRPRPAVPRSSVSATKASESQTAKRRTMREVAAVLEIAERARKIKTGSRREKVEYGLERFVNELITMAKASGATGSGFLFTMRYNERDLICSQRKGVRFERLLGKIVVPDTGLSVLEVLKKGQPGVSLTRYRLGIFVDEGGEHASFAEGVIAAMTAGSLKSRYTRTDLAKLRSDAAKLSAKRTPSDAQRASAAGTNILSINYDPQFWKTTTHVRGEISSRNMSPEADGDERIPNSRESVAAGDSAVIARGPAPLLCSHEPDRLPPCCKLEHARPGHRKVRDADAELLLRCHAHDHPWSLDDHRHRRKKERELVLGVCFHCGENDVARALRGFVETDPSTAELELDNWCRTSRRATERSNAEDNEPILRVEDLLRAARQARERRDLFLVLPRSADPEPISQAVIELIAASELSQRFQRALYALCCFARANAIKDEQHVIAAERSGRWDAAHVPLRRDVLERLRGVSRNTYANFLRELSRPGTEIGFPWGGPTVELAVKYLGRAMSRPNVYALRRELIEAAELPATSVEEGMNLLDELQRQRAAGRSSSKAASPVPRRNAAHEQAQLRRKAVDRMTRRFAERARGGSRKEPRRLPPRSKR
jgi:hypothetical protein